MKITHLRCEYKRNPLGIDVMRPRLSWEIRSNERNVKQSAYQIQVATDNQTFISPMWDTGKLESDQSIHVVYSGPALKSRTRYRYRVRIWDGKGRISDWSETAFWETALLNREEWVAKWITTDMKRDPFQPEPCLMLRKTFEIKGKIKQARIYATALGLYELHLNGNKTGDELLTPGWTSYNHRLQYQTYDVTAQLKNGQNTLGVILGDGWYKGDIGWRSEDERNKYGEEAAFLGQLYITYEDGKEDMIVTDQHWTSSTGPIIMSEIYHGEIYDARLEKNGWNMAEYDDTDWSGTRMVVQSNDVLFAQENFPIRIIEKLKPKQLIQTSSGETVLDMGQNMVGWVQFKVRGEAGRKITIRHGEVLDKDGNFYTDNLRSAKQTVQYILKGVEEEEFEPHFTFQGFRYVKVEGWPGAVNLLDFTGKVIHTDMERTGHFECSESMMNQLQQNIVWGQKGNFLDVPTDCPQRDERMGWTGDAQVFIRTAAFNMNIAPFFTKWLGDLKADQRADGCVPHVIPHVLGDKDYGSSVWSDAAVICPWTIYECYGDKRILENQYDSMKSWVDYIRKQGDNEFLWNTGFQYGDWLGLDAQENSYVGATPKDFIATAFYAYSTRLLKQTAEVLHKTKDAKQYGKLHFNILEHFRREFVTPNGRLIARTQTAHVVALMFDLLEEKDRKPTADILANLIYEREIHLTTGFVGTPYICHVLTEYGYNDLAYQLALQKDYPSWLYPITKGATTIWEHWDGIKEDGSFWSEAMNSFNHYAYGAIGEWLYRKVAGIDTDEQRPGYKHIHIKPQPGQGITYASAVLHSMYGEIRSGWKREGSQMKVSVSIPPNTTATVELPFARLDELLENGKKVTDTEGITIVSPIPEGVKLELTSGIYEFSYYRS